MKFKVFANARFLSHAETLKIFRRACARAGLDVAYTSGYNPRARISLPLPKSVGLACEDETCCLQLNCPQRMLDAENLKDKLNDQMPDGIELLSAEPALRRVSFQKGTAIYEFPVNQQHCGEQFKYRASQLLANDSLELQRTSDTKAKAKTVDVRCFLESVEVQGARVIISVGFSPKGSIKVDEILGLLGLDAGALDGPVTRTKVLWGSVSNVQN